CYAEFSPLFSSPLEDSVEAAGTVVSNAFEQIKSLEDQYLFPTYARVPLLLERGKVVFVYDSTGKKYLDFITGIGVNALGHAHPRILAAIREQSKLLIHTSNVYYNAYQGPLAQRLTKLSGMDRAFFTVSGTESVEGALKAVRSIGRAQSPEKIEIVALNKSFHGRTMGALSITGREAYRAPFGPLLPGVRFVDANDQTGLAAAVGPNTCAIILEPVQGEGGIFELKPEFMAAAARLAREHNACLIFDEIQCGLGRTGKIFAHQWTDIVPDIVVTAKPIANGYPLGAIMARGAAATTLSAGLHGTTFGGGPLACAVAVAVIDTIEKEGLLAHVTEIGDYFQRQLRELASRHEAIVDVRGKGLMVAAELDSAELAKAAAAEMMKRRILINCTSETVLRFLPPFILERAHVDTAIAALDEIFTERAVHASACSQGGETHG
ncbi:MAG: aspartate aminotransferase family protein, partial [Chloroflexota bacterium]